MVGFEEDLVPEQEARDGSQRIMVNQGHPTVVSTLNDVFRACLTIREL